MRYIKKTFFKDKCPNFLNFLKFPGLQGKNAGARCMMHVFFTREYTKYTAGYTFCFVVVAVGMDPLIKLGTNMIRHDQTFD
jgi:hypothetical protein